MEATAKLREVAPLFSREALLRQRAIWKHSGKTVVFTNGCFDLLHPGHIRLLEESRSMGDVLILALNSDDSIKRQKGPGRPILNEVERARIGCSLECVDAVTIFDENTPVELISKLLPDLLIKGADWSHFIAGREEVAGAGGRVVILALQSGFSTTTIVETALTQP